MAASIAAQAQTVNQSGVVQANSAQNVNGTIELVAGDTVNLNASSTLSAEGSSQASSAGGIAVQAGNTINNNGQAVADGKFHQDAGGNRESKWKSTGEFTWEFPGEHPGHHRIDRKRRNQPGRQFSHVRQR